MTEILKLTEHHGSEKKNFSTRYYDSCIKYLEEKAEKFHNEIIQINKSIKVGFYQIQTEIIPDSKDEGYKLKIKVKYYVKKSKQKYKANSHRQKKRI